jgi:hypothetical protein
MKAQVCSLEPRLGVPVARSGFPRAAAPALALALGLVISGCALRPPHFRGETRGARNAARRPPWTEWGVRFEGGWVYIAGAGSRHERPEKARQAAEEDARRRLAAAIETRIESEFESRTSGELATAGEQVLSSRLEQTSRDRLLALAGATLRGVVPEREHIEEYEVFGEGWGSVYDCWILLKVSERDFSRQLEGALEAGGRGR